jgi:hypothetical protein
MPPLRFLARLAVMPPRRYNPPSRRSFHPHEGSMQTRQTPIFSLVVIVIFALGIRLAYVWIHEHKADERSLLASAGNAYEQGLIARSILAGKGFSSPKGDDTGPTAMYTPVYPYFLAALYKIFGLFTRRSLLAALSVNCLLSSLTVIPIFLVARRLGKPGFGARAAWVWAAYPSVVATPDLNWTQSLSALLVALIVCATLALAESERPWPWAAYGLLWEFGCLVNPAVFAAMPFVLLWLAWKKKNDFRKLQFAAISILVFFAACLPWTLRNYSLFHQFVPFRSNFGYELWLGNNSRVPNSWIGSAALLDALYNDSELQRYEQLGEIAYVRQKKDEAVRFIGSHAREELSFTARRAATLWCGTWYMSVDPSWKTTNWKFRTILVFDTLLPLLAIPGLWILCRDRMDFRGPAGLVPSVFPDRLLYYPRAHRVSIPD